MGKTISIVTVARSGDYSDSAFASVPLAGLEVGAGRPLIATFDTQGGEKLDPQEVDYDTAVREPETAPARMDHAFSSWYDAKDCLRRWDLETKLTADVTLYAKWVRDTYNIDGRVTDKDGKSLDGVKVTMKQGNTGEGHIPELDLASRLSVAVKAAVRQFRRAAQQFPGPLPGGRPPGDVLEQHDQHEHAVQKLCGVGDSSRDVARGHAASGSLEKACIQDNGHHPVHQGVHGGIHEGEDDQHPQLDPDQRVVGFAKPHLFMTLPHTGLGDLARNSSTVLIEDRNRG